jgi:hypothetical protein
MKRWPQINGPDRRIRGVNFKRRGPLLGDVVYAVWLDMREHNRTTRYILYRKAEDDFQEVSEDMR